MTGLPFNLASSHYSGEEIYDIYLGGERSYWASMSDKKRAKWEAMAGWVNERALREIDVSEIVDEMLRRKGIRIPFITPAEGNGDADGIGMDVHDDDIAAAAQRFLKEVDEDTLKRLKIKPKGAPVNPEDYPRRANEFYAEMSAASVDQLAATKMLAEEMTPDAPPRPSMVEVIDTIAEGLKRLLG